MSLSTLAQATGPAPPVLAPAWRAEGAGTVIDVRCDADVAALPALVAVLARVAADRQGPVVIDLAAAAYIDTATVRMLSRAGEFFLDHGRHLTLRSPSTQALRLLSVAGLSDLIAPHPLRQDAARAARAAHPSCGRCPATPVVGLESLGSRPNQPSPAA